MSDNNNIIMCLGSYLFIKVLKWKYDKIGIL